MRKRLTAKRLRAESQADGLFPGDIGNMERKKNYHDMEKEYGNYSWRKGWDLPEDYNISDKRDEMNIGVKKVANAVRVAKAAATLAQLFLGPNTSRAIVTAQAKSFMKLGYKGIRDAIARRTAAEIEQATEESIEEVIGAEEAPAEVPAAVENGQETVEADEAELTTLDNTADETPAEAPVAEEEDGLDDIQTPETVAEEEETAPEMQIEIPEAVEEPTVIGSADELTQAQPDVELEAMFNGDATEETVETPVVEQKVSSKQGIKHLGGQPRLASKNTNKVDELAGIWANLKLPRL